MALRWCCWSGCINPPEKDFAFCKEHREKLRDISGGQEDVLS